MSVKRVGGAKSNKPGRIAAPFHSGQTCVSDEKPVQEENIMWPKLTTRSTWYDMIAEADEQRSRAEASEATAKMLELQIEAEEKRKELQIEAENREEQKRKELQIEAENREEQKRKELMWNINGKIAFEQEEETRLRESVLKVKEDSLGKPIKMKILVFGLTGHGKSTLCNGFRSALSGDRRVSHYHQTGIAGASRTFTRGFRPALYGDHLCIVDVSGIYESKSFKDADVIAILTGKVPFHVKLTEHLEVIDKENMAIPEPGTNDVSCVVIVLKPGTEFSPEIKRIMDIVDSLARDGAISRHLVLTHLDKTDPLFKDPENLPNIFKSGKVQAAVKQMSDRTGIPPSATSFVRNYWNENTTNRHSNILLLTVLDQVLYDAKENHERKLTFEKMKLL